MLYLMCEYIFLMFFLVVRLLMNFIASSDNQRVPLDDSIQAKIGNCGPGIISYDGVPSTQ